MGPPLLPWGSPSPTSAEGLPSPRSLGRPAPHLTRPFLLARGSWAEAFRGALETVGRLFAGSRRWGNTGKSSAPRPARPPGPAPRARGGGLSNNTVQPGSSSETTPQPVPSHFSGLRSSPHPQPWSLGTDLGPRPQHWGDGSTCDPPGCSGGASGLPPSATPVGTKGRERGGGGGRRVRVGETRAPGNSLGPAAARFHPASLPLPGSQPQEPYQRGSRGTWGRSPVGECPSLPSLGNHAHPHSKEVPPGEEEGRGMRALAEGAAGHPGEARVTRWSRCGVPGAELQRLLCPAHLSSIFWLPPPPHRPPSGLRVHLGGSTEVSAGTPTPELLSAGSY